MSFSVSSPATVIDLFCGAGGLSLGLRHAGWRIVQAIDSDRSAVETYRNNLGDDVVQAEISAKTVLCDSLLIAGGPPCQGFSSAGLRKNGDGRNSLVKVFATLIARYQPRAFLFENVEGFLTAEGGARIVDLLGTLLSAGYNIHLRKINAANYGVPQHRKRVIAIGGLGWQPTFPEPICHARGMPGASRSFRHLPPGPSLAEALRGLPKPSKEPPGVPQGHFETPLSSVDADRISRLEIGQTMRDLPGALRHKSYQRRAYRRVMDGTPTDKRGGAPAGLRRLRPDEPCKAITGAARNEFVHPLKDRFLTIRECARLQTFPDDFEFFGSSTEQSTLIGNAVPSLLAEVVGAHLLKELLAEPARADGGKLLSFIPTMAEGMSPILARVTQQVHTLFGGASPSDVQLPLWV
ncbi:MAG: DNA cytosine methyltransferase [Candidatus Coatesbacteria bacterium]